MLASPNNLVVKIMRERGQGTLSPHASVEILFVKDSPTDTTVSQVSGSVVSDDSFFVKLDSGFVIPWSDILVLRDAGANEYWKGDEYYPGSEELYGQVLEGDIPYDPPPPPRRPPSSG